MREAHRPEPDAAWHPIATMMYEALSDSGQSDFYQTSDWAMAYHMCEELSNYKNAGYWSKDGEWVPKRNGQILAAINAAFTELMATEGARRRLRVELSEVEVQDDATVIAMDEYQAMLEGTAK